MAGESDDVVHRHCQTMQHVRWGPLTCYIVIVASTCIVSSRRGSCQVDMGRVESTWSLRHVKLTSICRVDMHHVSRRASCRVDVCCVEPMCVVSSCRVDVCRVVVPIQRGRLESTCVLFSLVMRRCHVIAVVVVGESSL